jgi:hypothetical protein
LSLVLVPVILTLRARGCITEYLPWEVLESICGHSEEVPQDEEIIKEISDRRFASNPVPQPEDEAELASIGMPSECHDWPEVPSKKYEKNRFILSMTHVCRSWRVRLIGVKRLWREIAFTAEINPVGIRMATHFLTRLEDDDTTLHIYAGLPFSDIIDPTIGALLTRLRDQTHRWEKFFYWGRLAPYRPYLDLPASRLRHFSGHNDISHIILGQTTQFFAGHAPTLQSLVTSALGNWQPASLTNLRTLDLWDCAPELSIKSLLSALRSTPQLEEINLVSPNLPVLDCPPDEVVNLPHLKNLKVQNPDFGAIIGRFVIPNVQIVHLYGASNRGAGGLQAGRVFRAAHSFVGLSLVANQLPMFGQPIQIASLDVQHMLSGLRFIVDLTTERGTVLRIDLEWVGSFGIHSRLDYIRRSISALAEVPFVSPSFLHITADRSLVDYDNPLFCLDTVEHLVVEGGECSKVMAVMSARSDQPQILPKLRRLFFAEHELDKEVIVTIPEFLRSRRNLVMVLDPENRNYLVHLLSHVCVIEGEFVSSETMSPLA